ncbi:MAG TPA: hypothetical protein VGQ46_01285, partial [Thermoanaerobaculia bacterium]|nr:hypothetical protein [Thermoanaerobaculia bacterium]
MRPREEWNQALQATEQCVPIERLDALTASDREHVAHCARCEAEIALWNEFENGQTAASEAPAVESIVRSLQPKTAKVVDVASRRGPRLRMMAIAAMLIVIAGAGYVIENREPSVNVAIR